jgi:hypothetical protein
MSPISSESKLALAAEVKMPLCPHELIVEYYSACSRFITIVKEIVNVMSFYF